MGWEMDDNAWVGKEGYYGSDYPSTWNPLTDWNHTMEVVEKMRKNGAKFCWDELGDKDIGFWTKEEQWGIIAINHHGNPQRAICIAALLAVSDDKYIMLSGGNRCGKSEQYKHKEADKFDTYADGSVLPAEHHE